MRPNETVNNLAEVMRISVAAAATPCNLEPAVSSGDALIKKYQSSMSLTGLVKPNIVGRILLSTALAGFVPVRTKRCDINKQIEALSSN